MEIKIGVPRRTLQTDLLTAKKKNLIKKLPEENLSALVTLVSAHRSNDL